MAIKIILTDEDALDWASYIAKIGDIDRLSSKQGLPKRFRSLTRTTSLGSTREQTVTTQSEIVPRGSAAQAHPAHQGADRGRL